MLLKNSSFGRNFRPVCLLLCRIHVWFGELNGLEIDYEMPQLSQWRNNLRGKGGKLRPGSFVRLVNFAYLFKQKKINCLFLSITKLGLLI